MNYKYEKLSIRIFTQLLAFVVAVLIGLSMFMWWRLLIDQNRNSDPQLTESALPTQASFDITDVLRAVAGASNQTDKEATPVEAESWRILGLLRVGRSGGSVLLSLNGERPILVMHGGQLGDSRWQLKQIGQSDAVFFDPSNNSETLRLVLPAADSTDNTDSKLESSNGMASSESTLMNTPGMPLPTPLPLPRAMSPSS